MTSDLKVKIRDFRGIERADVTAAPIALIAGHNAKGKTAVCQAFAAGATGHAIPILRPGHQTTEVVPLLKKTETRKLMRRGMKKGTIDLQNETGATRITYPKGEVVSERTPPRSSVWAAGMSNEHGTWIFFALTEEKRSALLSQMLNAEATGDDLALELKDHGFSDSDIQKMLIGLGVNGWDAMHKAMKDHGAKQKGQWLEATGEKTYGTKKSARWLPEGWDDTRMAAATEEALAGAVHDATRALEKAIGTQAIDAAELDALEVVAGRDLNRLDLLEKTDTDAKAALTKAEGELAIIKGKAEATGGMPGVCPVCKADVIILTKRDGPVTTYSLIPADPERPKGSDLTTLKKKRSAADSKVVRMLRERDAAGVCLASAQAENQRIEAAKASLKLQTKGAKGKAAEKARTDLEEATRDLEDVRKWERARTLHRRIERNTRVVAVLAPDGLRRSKLVGAIKPFNEGLENLCRVAGWGRVEITEELAVEYDGEPYVLLSDSEKYKCRATLQIALAVLDKSECVVLDGADILDTKGGGRASLFRLIRHYAKAHGGHVVVGMTLASIESVPAMVGVGKYWVENSVCSPVNG